MIPLFIDLTARRVMIFGGGDVAARKAEFFVREADVQVVSRSFSKKIAALPVTRQEMDIHIVSDAELERLVDGAFVVVAALPEQSQNNRIGRICRRAGILFNNADGERGDLIIPSSTGGQHYTIAVSTDGESPAVSRFIREHLESRFPSLDAMIALQGRLRKRLKIVEPSQERRNAILREVLNDRGVWEALDRSPAEAEELVGRRYLHD